MRKVTLQDKINICLDYIKDGEDTISVLKRTGDIVALDEETNAMINKIRERCRAVGLKLEALIKRRGEEKI